MDDRFLGPEFPLSNEVARELFHPVAELTPIVDLRNHLSPAAVAADRVYETLTDLWLEDDHAPRRARRAAGRYVTSHSFSSWGRRGGRYRQLDRETGLRRAARFRRSARRRSRSRLRPS